LLNDISITKQISFSNFAPLQKVPFNGAFIACPLDTTNA
jgi:hypothetical protein